METALRPTTPQDLPCQDRLLLANIGQRLTDMAAFLASEGLQDAAELCGKAMGVIRAKLAATTAASPKTLATVKVA